MRSQVLLESVPYVGCFETGVHCLKCKKSQSHWPKWRSIFWMFVENPTNWLIWLWLANMGQGLHPQSSTSRISQLLAAWQKKTSSHTAQKKHHPSMTGLPVKRVKKKHPSVWMILPQFTSILPLEESNFWQVFFFGILPAYFFEIRTFTTAPGKNLPGFLVGYQVEVLALRGKQNCVSCRK